MVRFPLTGRIAASPTPWPTAHARRPLRRRRDDIDKPIAVNIDTGCIYGGHLTAYPVESESILQVRSRQPIDTERIEYAVSPTVASIEAPSAWGARGRTFAG